MNENEYINLKELFNKLNEWDWQDAWLPLTRLEELIREEMSIITLSDNENVSK